MYLTTATLHADPEADYVEYLKRSVRTKNMTCSQAHKLLLSKLTASSYGVHNTESPRLLNLICKADMERANESLRCQSDTDKAK